MAADERLTQAAFSAFLRDHKPAETTLADVVVGFYHAITWREPFIVMLLATHFFLLVFAVLVRRHLQIQATLWFVILASVYCAEYLNNLGARHWQEFATQNYFDRTGVFISLLFSLPLILIALYIVVNFVLHTSRMLIAVKRAEFKAQREAKKQKQQ